MKVAELKSTLKNLAGVYADAGDAQKSAGLLKLTEVLDDKHGEQKVDKFLSEIRRKRDIKPRR